MNSRITISLIKLPIIASFFCVFNAHASEVTIPYTLQSGQVIKASELNENFNSVYNKVNANDVLLETIKHPGSQHTDNGDGTVTDRLTGLVWMKNADCWNYMTWNAAIDKVAELNAGTATCTGYTGPYTDWRLPSPMELKRFFEFTMPAVTSDHPFSVARMYTSYWSNTTDPRDTSSAFTVSLRYIHVDTDNKLLTTNRYVWPVRGGQ